MITNGSYKARAIGPVVLGKSQNKGTPFIELYFQIIGGPNDGGKVRWTTYFTEKTNERSIESLLTLGFTGEDLSEFADGELHGLDANEVDIVVELEEYTSESGEKRTTPRVQWVNRSGGYLNTDAAMNEESASAFGDTMKGMLMALRAKRPAPKDPSDFKFGANVATPPPAAAATPGNGKAF